MKSSLISVVLRHLEALSLLCGNRTQKRHIFHFIHFLQRPCFYNRISVSTNHHTLKTMAMQSPGEKVGLSNHLFSNLLHCTCAVTGHSQPTSLPP